MLTQVLLNLLLPACLPLSGILLIKAMVNSLAYIDDNSLAKIDDDHDIDFVSN